MGRKNGGGMGTTRQKGGNQRRQSRTKKKSGSAIKGMSRYAAKVALRGRHAE